MSEQHEHRWKKCAWICWDDWYESRRYYPPSKLIPVEVCEVAGCGLIRVPPENLKKITEKGRT
jgi:hypothetical protein